MMSTYLGVAVAAGILKIASAALHNRLTLSEPTTYALALLLVFVFCAVFGLRAAFSVPTDLDANWPFRMRSPTVAASAATSRLLILAIGVVPISVVEFVAATVLWSPWTGLSAAIFTLVSGCALTEFALANWTRVPFASAHEPSTDTMKSRWPAFVFALFVYGYAQASLKLAVLTSPGGLAFVLVVGLTLMTIIRISASHALQKRSLTLDVPHEGPQTLDLSEAL